VARITLDRSSFSFWSTPDHAWQVAPGTYTVRAGTSSRDLPLEASISLP